MTTRTVLRAKVATLDHPYPDGTPNLEINMSAEEARGQAFVTSERTNITLRIDGRDYGAAVLANRPHHTKVWVSPTIYGSGGERLTLGRVLTGVGFRARDVISLDVCGTTLEVLPADASRE